jgi:hypothetical protein
MISKENLRFPTLFSLAGLKKKEGDCQLNKNKTLASTMHCCFDTLYCYIQKVLAT